MPRLKIALAMSLSAAKLCAHPATYLTDRFAQPVRTLLPADRFPAPAPATEAVDASGHRYVVGPFGVTVALATGERHALPGATVLPVSKLTCVACAANGDVWFGSTQGAIRWTGGRVGYYAGRRWLPDDSVESLECLPDGSVRLWTPGGISHLRFPSMTLEEKAAHYEQLTDARHNRFGFVTGCRLLQPGDLSRTEHHIDDNDGLWTAMYVAAEAFRYAVTGADDAKSKACASLLAILSLEEKTSIPGFPARALTHKSEADFGRARGGEWHPTLDGEWEWKGDTSSDEMDGHYFAWPVYYDLVADEEERERLRSMVRRVTDYILDNGYYLLDLDRRPTRWGVWAPERLNDDPRWRAERGLNSLEILSYLKVAHHIAGDARYEAAYRELTATHHYARNMLEQKVLPGDFPGAENNHSDDELAFLAYYGLLRYETDPNLRALYVASLERSWQIERAEKCPLWNFIYGATTGRPCDSEAAVESLQEIPLDLIEWKVTNSHRADLKLDPHIGRHGERQALVPVRWPERRLHKWNGNPYELDGGNDLTEECGTFWLLPYWLGRYHGIIGDCGDLDGAGRGPEIAN